MTLTDQADMLHNRLRKRARHLRKWARRDGVTCYRLYDRDIPEIPLAIDWYDGHVHMARYQRRSDRDPAPDAAARAAAWLEAMVDAACRALDVPSQRVFFKHRARQRGAAQYPRLGHTEHEIVVTEGGHRFAINLADYLDTGLFLDHRQTREWVEREAAGKRVLNLFCYTGAFTVYAAAGGARETLSLDLSRRYLTWAERNMALNDLAGPSHRFARVDVMQFLARGHSGPPFDLVVLDPPTFSNSKKMTEVLDVVRDHRALINHTLALVRPGGIVYFSTNARRFSLDRDSITATEIDDVTDATTPPDFRARKPHRCWRIVK